MQDGLVLPIDALRTGDVLLSKARCWLSGLMAWNGECPYSHAAIMVAEDAFVEAVPPRVRLRRLTELASTAGAVHYIDVYRPRNADFSEPRPSQLRQLAVTARFWVGWPFALSRMKWLALDTLLRHKLGWSTTALRLQRWGGLSCTELVYRALDASLDFVLGGSAHERPAQAALPAHLQTSPCLRYLGRLDLGARAHAARPAMAAGAAPLTTAARPLQPSPRAQPVRDSSGVTIASLDAETSALSGWRPTVPPPSLSQRATASCLSA